MTAAGASALRAVVDTSTLVSPRLRRALQQRAQLGTFEAVWSPWIVAELNRVLVWRWLAWIIHEHFCLISSATSSCIFIL